jgi:hypothetical protein
MANPSPPNFSLILAGNRWINPDGTPTTYFFRLIVNLFAISGNGQPPSVTDITNVTLSQGSASNGPDYSRQMADLQTLQMSVPDPSGRISTLERQVADLQEIVMSLRKTQDLNPVMAQLAALTALTMGA